MKRYYLAYLNKFMLSILVICGMLLVPNAHAAETVPFDRKFNPVDEVRYSIKVSGDGQERVLSITDLERLPLHRANFSTRWNLKGDFVGVKLSDLLNHVGIATFERLYVLASNDYNITIESDDPGIENVILASRINGEPFALDHKGPFFIMWPDQAEDVLAGKAAEVKWLWGAVEIRKIR
ncbi:MAG: hypothetical protein ACI8XX_002355 [Polaribacter sp.]|jgi:hypothetical protein